MIRFLTDEDFNNDILRGVLRRLPALDVVRVQDVGLRTADDLVILPWAAREGRVILTHDTRTMIDSAYQRVRDGLPMPGLMAVSKIAPLAVVIDDLCIIAELIEQAELRDQVVYVPL